MNRTVATALLALAPTAFLSAQEVDSASSSQNPLRVLELHHGGVTSLRFSPDGNILASADLAGKVIIWRTSDWASVRTLNHGSEVYCVAFSGDGRTLASAGGDLKVRIWSTRTGKQLRSIAMNNRAPTLVFAPDGTLLIGTEDGAVHFVDPATARETRSFKTGGPVLELAVSADGNTLATALPIRVWDYHTLMKRSELASLGQLGLALSADGKRLASAESTGGALLWTLGDSATYMPLRTTVEKRAMGVHSYESFAVNMPVASIDLSRNAGLMVGGGTTGLVYVWRPVGSQPPVPAKLAGHTMTVSAIALSLRGDVVASGSLDRTIRIWKLDSAAK